MLIQSHSKHCKACNRCCDKFDHHCAWLNNCIGANNYAIFIKACIALLVYVMANSALAAYHIGEHRKGDFVADAEIVLIIIQLVFFFAILIASIQLISWHVYFWKKGIKTFTHIQFTKQQE